MTEPANTAERGARSLDLRRWIGWFLIAFGALILIGGLWVAVTGFLARSQLQAARAEVHLLRQQIGQGQLDAARHTLAQLREHASSAHSLTSGPAWAVAAWVPGGEPMDGVRTIAGSVAKLADDTLPALLQARSELSPASLRRADGTIDVGPILRVAPTLARADAALAAAVGDVGKLPTHTWLSQVDNARADLLAQLSSLGNTVHSASLGAQVVPALVGNDGVKRYFVSFQNNAEARGAGGLPGAFGILQADHGKLKFLRFENDSYLSVVRTGLNFGPDFNQLYAGYEATSVYVNSNASPHFPYAAQVWTAMWQKVTGQHLDGAMAVDPTVLSYLLAATGPVTLHDGTVVNAANVVPLTESTVYARFPSAAERKAYLLQVAKTVSTHVINSRASASELVNAGARALSERRVLAWSADPKTESLLAQTAAGGVVPQTTAPYVGVTLTNDAGNKLDYYMTGTVDWQRSGCGAQRSVTVTVKITNNAPTGLPRYVINRSDKHSYRVRPGDARDYLSYAATSGALLDSVTVDGKESTLIAGSERGHPVYVLDLEFPRGQTRTVVLKLTEPAGAGAPIVSRQPLVHPFTVTVQDAQCG